MEQMGSAAAFAAHSKGSKTLPATDRRAGKGAEEGDDDDDDEEEEEEEDSVVSAGDDSEDGGEARLPDVKLIVDPSLSVLARKLRMVGQGCLQCEGEESRGPGQQHRPRFEMTLLACGVRSVASVVKYHGTLLSTVRP